MDPRQQLELNPHCQHRAGHHGNVHEQRCPHVGHHLDFHVDQHDRVRRRRPDVFVHGSERRNLHHHQQHHQQSLTRTGLHRQRGCRPDGRQWGLCRDRVAGGRRHGHRRTFRFVLPAEHRRQRRHHVLRQVFRCRLARARQRGFADADRRQLWRQYRHHRRPHALLELLGPGAHDQRRLAHRIGNTIINGGTLSPGNSIGTITVNGNLVMTAAASYLVEISPTNADRTNVAGTASLGGTVQAAFASGSYVTRAYTILSAAGGRSGTFNALTTTNLPAGFIASLSYTATDVNLNLTAALGALTSLGVPNAAGGSGASACAFSINQCNVANALNAFFNNGGALPPAFVNIFGLTGVNLGNALSQLSGEAATGAQQAAFQLTNQFLGIMLDPFVDGRSGVAGSGGPALGFAPGREELPDDIALAYAKLLKAPPKPASFDERWTVWGAGYGGSNRTSGDPAVVGSHDLAARAAGGAAGFDYHLSRDSVVGVALAGGGTDWSLAQGLGGGKSDAFQAGVYGATRWGPAYLAAALSFTNHWMSTDRFAFAGDHLTARFNAQSFGGRVEGGYRFATIYGGLTPYAAIQAQSFHTPGYSEADLNAGGFALGFNSRNATDTRSELGG